MDLTDNNTLAVLFARPSSPNGKRSGKRTTEPKLIRSAAQRRASLGRASTARRCRCGCCQTCIENARWERIFQEKFADPDYYGLRNSAHVSPINDLLVGGARD